MTEITLPFVMLRPPQKVSDILANEKASPHITTGSPGLLFKSFSSFLDYYEKNLGDSGHLCGYHSGENGEIITNCEGGKYDYSEFFEENRCPFLGNHDLVICPDCGDLSMPT